MKKFPKNFYWGTATSAYQVEGGIKNNWSEAGDKYDAGLACDHYNRFEQDFNLAKNMNNNAHRFSIEWARIEPEEGRFDQKEIEHYKKVVKALKDRGLEPFVTLWHFSLPVWFSENGGWSNRKSVDCFIKYAEFVVKNLPEVKFWTILNEPVFCLAHMYITGIFPPFKKLSISIFRSFFNLVRTYKKTYKIIHKLNPNSKVSITQATQYFEPARKWCPIERLFAWFAWFFSVDYFYLLIKKHIDYIGVNYYNHNRIVWHPPFRKNFNKEVSDLGWEIYPEGIYHVLKKMKKYNKPIYVLENGISDSKDRKRTRFITEHLEWIHKAIEEGIDVEGYFYWSFLDNYEMPDIKRFKAKFGLIEIDYKTQKRIPRPSSKIYAKICKNSAIET